MDPRLDQNKTELGVLVFAIALEMLPDGDGLAIDECVSHTATQSDSPPEYNRGGHTFFINM